MTIAGGRDTSTNQAVDERVARARRQPVEPGDQVPDGGRELQNRRSEIQNALSSMKGMISDDQTRALQKQLADMDAAIKQQSIAQTGALGSADLALRDKLGTGALNLDTMKALLQNQQFGSNLGFDIGNAESQYYLRSLGL